MREDRRRERRPRHGRQSLRDVLMLAHSGLSIAMGNASREVQRVARQITTSNKVISSIKERGGRFRRRAGRRRHRSGRRLRLRRWR
ncbi:HAD hydrolase family protein [Microbispora rosea]|uniref:HAD hydrolase family protein n=1 Tax=Microbispora rosea TaxID=58117 RepID=UPI003D94E900